MKVSNTIPVIDLFAGPGGLGEGFSAYSPDGRVHPFRIGLSIEKDPIARETLRLRSFFRQFRSQDVPEIYYRLLRCEFPLKEFPNRLKEESPDLLQKWKLADAEAMRAELGASDEVNREISTRIKKTLGPRPGMWVLIGGPPCQAYSVVGRARNRGNADYRIEDDHRSSLYREYLRIIAEHRPPFFVMENVKGMLSANVGGQRVFDRIMNDLRSPLGDTAGKRKKLHYRVVPVVRRTTSKDSIESSEFIVECEKYGIPQQRHRVILVGLREDLGDFELPLLEPSAPPTVKETIGALPPLRSGISRRKVGTREGIGNSGDDWLATIRELTIEGEKGDQDWFRSLKSDKLLYDTLTDALRYMKVPPHDMGSEFVKASSTFSTRHRLYNWFVDDRVNGVCNHASRCHMYTDLARYLFVASYGAVYGVSPKLDQFPPGLLPNHQSASSGNFDDRFRVQVADSPSTTVTSHISKDGHYFIHYDPQQCRSLTVREAARLQTFQDNYLFCGPRTSQYVQVGNAVPPLLARQIAECIWGAIQMCRQVRK